MGAQTPHSPPPLSKICRSWIPVEQETVVQCLSCQSLSHFVCTTLHLTVLHYIGNVVCYIVLCHATLCYIVVCHVRLCHTILRHGTISCQVMLAVCFYLTLHTKLRHLTQCNTIYLSTYLSVYLSIYLPIYLSIYLSVYLSLSIIYIYICTHTCMYNNIPFNNTR